MIPNREETADGDPNGETNADHRDMYYARGGASAVSCAATDAAREPFVRAAT